ncbi:MAG: CHAT domain-containing protein [Acidobacteriota bacterium]
MSLVALWPQRLTAPTLAAAAVIVAVGLSDALSPNDSPQVDGGHRVETPTESSTTKDSDLLERGRTALARGDLATAERFLDRAHRDLVRDGPESLRLADVLEQQAVIAGQRSDFPRAVALTRQALEIRRRLAPDSVEVARDLHLLGIAALRTGAPQHAEERFLEALALLERLEPDSPQLPKLLGNLGVLALERGEIATAEDFFRRSLQHLEALEAPSLARVPTLANLGKTALVRGELDAAEHYFRRALAITASDSPTGLDHAFVLEHLGHVALERGELEYAERRLRGSLGLREALAPESLAVAGSLSALAYTALRAERADDAARLAQRALAIQRRVAPESVGSAWTLTVLGSAAEAAGEPIPAAEHYHAARRIFAQQAPHHEAHAATLHRLGVLAEAHGDHDRAIALYDQALSVLEAKVDHLGGTYVVRAAFTADRGALVDDLLDLHLRRGALAAAVAVIERTRGRGLHAILTEARLPVTAPPTARRAWNGPEDGTLVLMVALTAERGHLLALGPERNEASLHAVPGRTVLTREVRRLRAAMAPGRSLETARFHSRRIGRLLLDSVTSQIERADRVLIVADSPLHGLPFAALRIERPATGGPVALVDLLPIAYTPSLSVDTALAARRRHRPSSDTAPTIAVFGDPATDPSAAAWTSRLPASATEARRIAALFPSHARLFVGAEASEDAVRRHTERSVLHLAGHALVATDDPFASALVLAAPRPGSPYDGLLEAREVFEQLRVDADLVTLSACGTALGTELGAEGMLGLTRAFLAAGAGSVVSSLWPVADRSSAELMTRFYRHLHAGLPKDEALRSAQRELAAEPATAHPGHWAAFRLEGDRTPLWLPPGPRLES